MHLVTHEPFPRYCLGDAETIVLMLWLTTVRDPDSNLLTLRLANPTQDAYMVGVRQGMQEQGRGDISVRSAQEFLQGLAEKSIVSIQEE